MGLLDLVGALLGDTKHPEPDWSREERQEAGYQEYIRPQITAGASCAGGCSGGGHLDGRRRLTWASEQNRLERERQARESADADHRQEREIKASRENVYSRLFRPGRVSVELIDGKFVEVK